MKYLGSSDYRSFTRNIKPNALLLIQVSASPAKTSWNFIRLVVCLLNEGFSF